MGVAPHLSNAIGGVRLQVDASELKDARAVLAAPYVVPDPMLEGEEGDAVPPPQARSFAHPLLVAVITAGVVVALVMLAVGAS